MKSHLISSFLAVVCIVGTALGADIPAEVEKAISERKASIAEADKVYLAKLEALLKRFNDSGNSKDAELVAKLIKDAGGEAAVSEATDPAADAILAKLVGTWKRDYDNSVFLFKDSKSGSWAGKEDFTMSYDAEKKKVILISKKWVDELTFTGSEDVLRGGDKNGKRYKLTRVK
jgi:hypothetical protein